MAESVDQSGMLFGKTRIYPGTFTTLATKKQFPLENRCKFKVVEIIKFT